MNGAGKANADQIERMRNIPRIEAAIQEGVRAALLQHKRAGNPVAVWRDGQVVWIAPEDIPVDGDDGG